MTKLFFTSDNTEGYTSDQLKRANLRWDEITENWSEDDWEFEESTNGLAQKILEEVEND